MEEERAYAKSEEEDLNTEAAEQVVEEDPEDAGEIIEDEMYEMMSASNSEMKEKGDMVQKVEESEEYNEYREKVEEEILDEMEELPVKTHKMSSAGKETEMEFIRKKKPEPKIRKVNMDLYYPDESKSSIDEMIEEKKKVYRKSDVGFLDTDDFEELIDPNKDYSLVDPSFLDEFFSTEEEHITESEKTEARRIAERLEETEEEEDEFQIYIQPPDREPSDRVYDRICDLETPVSSDESFKVTRFRYIPRRRSRPTHGFEVEENKWLSQTKSVQSIGVPSTALINLLENIAPALKKTLVEIATYQPSNAVYYMTHSLLHKAKSPEELGLEPDPHLIQLIVDGQKKKKKHQQILIPKKPDEILFATYAESHISTPQKEAKADTLISDDDDEDPSQLHKFQRKYRKAKKNIVTEEKAKRSNLDRKTMLPGICLGPTSLPLSPDAPSRRKLPSFKPSGVERSSKAY